MEFRRRITQRELARAAGVDVSTVSLALNRHPRIPEKTRQRILQCAERLGYQPDPALTTLAAQRWQGRRDYRGLTLALAIDSRDRHELEWRLYADGIRERASAIGYGVSDFFFADYPTPRRFWEVIRQRGIRGVIFIQSRSTSPDLWMSGAMVPSVHCGFLHPVEADVVMPNLEAAVRLAWQNTARPAERLAFYLPVEPDLYSDQILLGTALALCQSHQAEIPATIFDGTPQSLRKLLKWKPHRVITINEKQARHLHRCGLSARSTLHPLHLLNLHRNKTGVDLRLKQVGAAATDFLELKIRRYPLGLPETRQTLMIDPAWWGGYNSA